MPHHSRIGQIMSAAPQDGIHENGEEIASIPPFAEVSGATAPATQVEAKRALRNQIDVSDHGDVGRRARVALRQSIGNA